MRHKITTLTFFVFALVIAGYFLYSVNKNKQSSEEIEVPQSTAARQNLPDSEQNQEITGTEKSFPLIDVTNGATFNESITTNGEALGILEVSSGTNQTMLRAVFEKIPVLPQSYYYEGWLVSSEDPSVNLSTGRVAMDDKNNFVNDFVSSDDLSIYDRYILALEPEAEHIGPAIHLVEGKIEW